MYEANCARYSLVFNILNNLLEWNVVNLIFILHYRCQ